MNLAQSYRSLCLCMHDGCEAIGMQRRLSQHWLADLIDCKGTSEGEGEIGPSLRPRNGLGVAESELHHGPERVIHGVPLILPYSATSSSFQSCK